MGGDAAARGAAGVAGFTLLEVLVAFIIAALALGALTQGVAGGLLSARVAAHTQEALSRAQSHMAALGDPSTGDPSMGDPTPGDRSGDDGGGFTWRVSVVPTAVAPRAPAGAAPLRAKRAVLYAVTVVISWRLDGGERRVALSTERVGEAPPDPP